MFWTHLTLPLASLVPKRVWVGVTGSREHAWWYGWWRKKKVRKPADWQFQFPTLCLHPHPSPKHCRKKWLAIFIEHMVYGRHCTKSFTNINSFHYHNQLYKVGAITLIILIWLKYRTVMKFIQGHTAIKWYTWDFKSRWSRSKIHVLSTMFM